MTAADVLLDRRRALALIGAGLAAAAIPTVLAPSTASATRVWCRTDPDVLLEGTPVKIEVMAPEEYLGLIDAPTVVKFNLPSAVDRQLVFADDGFNGLGYKVVFSTAYQPNKSVAKFSVNLNVSIAVSTSTKIPLQVVVTTGNGVVTQQANDARSGANVNFTVYGSL